MGRYFKQSTKNGTIGFRTGSRKVYRVVFYRSASGREPVRHWLKKLDPRNRKRIGEDLFTLQVGWPLGMPLARKVEPDLWELRSRIDNGIARIMFTEKKECLVLLHGFIKKSQKLPAKDLKSARRRLLNLKLGEKS